MKVSTAALVLLTITTFQPVHASDNTQLTAGDLYKFCSSKDSAVNTACRFYILGAIDGISLGGGSVKDSSGRFVAKAKTDFCIPDSLPLSQSVTIYESTAQADFVKFPEDRAMPAISLLAAAMLHHFPCQKRS
jgi:hypothetical protein